MFFVKDYSLTIEKHLKHESLSLRKGNGIFQRGVESIEVEENIVGEGDFLDQY